MIYFLIPVFNEAENIEELAKNLQEVLPEEERTYVFVNDGSSDETVNRLNRYFEENSLHILNNPGNQGPGYSFQAGFKFIIEELKSGESDAVITLEGDNTSDLGILPIMLTLYRSGFNLVLASPYAQGGGFDETTFTRKLTSFTANLILRLWFDVKVLTLSSFYRIYSPELLKVLFEKYPVLIREKGFISKVEILVKALRSGAKVIEVPMILHSKKRKGKSKLKVMKTTLSYMRFFLFSRV
jgi:dolichol-phosphate mannosyltransferase